jgi:hypothetical protein
MDATVLPLRFSRPRIQQENTILQRSTLSARGAGVFLPRPKKFLFPFFLPSSFSQTGRSCSTTRLHSSRGFPSRFFCLFSSFFNQHLFEEKERKEQDDKSNGISVFL